MKKLINLIALIVLAATGASADISITFDTPNQIGTPGETLHFMGTITNTDTNLSDPDVFLNFDSYLFPLADATVNDNFFPYFLLPPNSDLPSGGSTGDLDLFDIVLANPETQPLGTYAGEYELFGGADGGAGTAGDFLVQTNFSVTVTPEPAFVGLLGIGLVSLFWLHRSRRSRTGAARA